MKLAIYLNYGGNCEQAFRFYEEHLGGKITMMMAYGQQPNPANVPPSWKNSILHERQGTQHRCLCQHFFALFSLISRWS